MTREMNIEALLAPLPAGASEHSLSGEWLRYEGTYDRILEARREDDETLPQGVWKSKLKRADWSAVEALCIEVLKNRSKDLQIAAYLTEAWLHQKGLAGACAGMHLLGGLCQRFWNSLYPLLDGNDASYRLAPLEWLDQKLPSQLKLLPLAEGGREGRRPIRFVDWERVILPPGRQSGTDADSSTEYGPPFTQESIIAALEVAPAEALVVTLDQLLALQAAVNELGKTLEALLGNASAALLQTRNCLEQILGFLQPAGERARQAREATQTATKNPESAEVGSIPASVSVQSPARGELLITSRARAYQIVEEVADYLLRTEPHSPTGYLLKRAVHWGEMPLTQLLVELVPDERNLAAIYALLGVANKAPM